MAVFRGFAWRDVPLYVFAQLLGAFCGASITYGTYAGLIDKFENGRRTMATAGLFATFTVCFLAFEMAIKSSHIRSFRMKGPPLAERSCPSSHRPLY
jgi:glycerol uptake facilitator-like aquaporin